MSANYPLYGVVTTEPAGRYTTLQLGANALVEFLASKKFI